MEKNKKTRETLENYEALVELSSPGDDAGNPKKEGLKSLLSSISGPKDLQKVLKKVFQATGSFGIDWANSLFQKMLQKFGLFEKFSKTLYWTSHAVLRAIARIAFKFKIYGDMFPEYGTGIVVGNHVSHVDPFFIGLSVHKRVVWMSKEENFETPIIRSIFSNFGAFPVKRGQGDIAAIQRARDVINGGDWLGIFPEGTRAVSGEIGEFRTGAVRLAIEERVPIVPIVTAGLDRVLPKNSFLMKFGTPVSTLVGQPITFEDYYDTNPTYHTLQKLSVELRDHMLAMKAELNGIQALRDGTAHEEARERLSIGYPVKVA